MAKYKWLLFDLDNTLLDFGASSKEAFFHLFKERGFNMEREDYEVYRRINYQVWADMEKDLFDHQELKSRRWALFLESKGIDGDPLSLNASYFDHIKTNPIYVAGAQQLVKDVAKDYKLCLITNGLAEVQKPRLKLSGLDLFLDEIVISDLIGFAKPHNKFFEYTADLIGHPPKDEVLVIGDSLGSDILGGNKFGYDTCWHKYDGMQYSEEIIPTYQIENINELRALI